MSDARDQSMRPRRIFLGLKEIAGFYCNLHHGLTALGHTSTLATTNNYVLQYEGGESNWILDGARKTERLYRQSKLTPIKAFWLVVAQLYRNLLLIWAIPRHDVFIFSFGISFLPRNLDLPLLRLLGKCVICNIGHGSDSRPAYLSGRYRNDDESLRKAADAVAAARKRRRQLRYLEAHADYIISTPVIAHFLTRPFLVLNLIGLPFRAPLAAIIPASEVKSSDQVNILHAPTYPIGKGSPVIRATIKRLQAKGYNINFVEITGRPHPEVLTAIQRCDFVVDEIYNTTSMGGLATEAAYFGKPSVVGGYGWGYLRSYIPPEAFPPNQICYPHELESAIEEMIIDPEKRRQLGHSAQCFVRDQWSPESVAKRMVKIIEGNAPQQWHFDPMNIRYLHGWGLSEEAVRENLRTLVREFGAEQLGLDDKPDLVAHIHSFIDQSPQ